MSKKKLTPLEQIRQGILEQNWEEVIAGYESMTGQSFPKPVHDQEETKKKLFQKCVLALEQVFAQPPAPEPVALDEVPAVSPPAKPKKKTKPDFTHGEPERSSKAETFHNTFVDDRSLCGEAAALDSKMLSGLRMAPRRQPPVKVRATCETCQQTFSVDPILGPRTYDQEGVKYQSSYVCDHCLSKRHKRR